MEYMLTPRPSPINPKNPEEPVLPNPAAKVVVPASHVVVDIDLSSISSSSLSSTKQFFPLIPSCITQSSISACNNRTTVLLLVVDVDDVVRRDIDAISSRWTNVR